MEVFEPLKIALVDFSAFADGVMPPTEQTTKLIPAAGEDEIIAACEGDNNLLQLTKRAILRSEDLVLVYSHLRIALYFRYQDAKKSLGK